MRLFERRDQQHRREGGAGVAELGRRAGPAPASWDRSRAPGDAGVAARVGPVEHGLGEVLRRAAGLLRAGPSPPRRCCCGSRARRRSGLPTLCTYGSPSSPPDVDDLVGDACCASTSAATLGRRSAAPRRRRRRCARAPSAARRTRQSLAMTSTLSRVPAFTASSAARSAVVPARSEPPKSAVTTSRRRSSALAIRLAPCFSLYGYEVEAKSTPPTVRAVDAAQAVGRRRDRHRHASSSKFATARSPPPPRSLAPAAGDRRERQPQHRDVRTVGSDPNHPDSLRGL